MPSAPPHRHNGGPLSDVDAQKLWGHVRALEVLEEQKTDIALDTKVRKELAKADGFDNNILAAILKRRKIGEGETRAADDMVHLYEEALREQGALPLEQTKERSVPRRTTEEIAEQIHGEALPDADDNTVRAAATGLERLAQESGAKITITGAGGSVTFGEGQHPMHDDAEMLDAARKIVIQSGKGSTSFLQREMHVGYNTATRLIEQLQKDGVVSAPDHVGRREVLVIAGPTPERTHGPDSAVDDEELPPRSEDAPQRPETGSAAPKDIFD